MATSAPASARASAMTRPMPEAHGGHHRRAAGKVFVAYRPLTPTPSHRAVIQVFPDRGQAVRVARDLLVGEIDRHDFVAGQELQGG